MLPRKYHFGFDEILRDKGVICEDTKGDSVHRRMDRRAKKFGIDHRELDDFHSDSAIRDFIDNIIASIGTISQERATDYIRVAYGHLCLDYMASKLKNQQNCTYEELDWNEAYKRTWKYFKR